LLEWTTAERLSVVMGMMDGDNRRGDLTGSALTTSKSGVKKIYISYSE